jgi:Serine dehydrogenase proteinase
VARALRTSFKEIEVYVPHIAASGGILIALTGDRIFMGCMSQLSPLDPQVYYDGRMMSALNARSAYNRLCEAFAQTARDEAPYPQRALAEKLDPLLMEDWNGAVETAIEYVTKILSLSKYNAAAVIADNLVYHFNEHDSDIDYEVAKNLGLRVHKYDSSQKTQTIWRHFRRWLGMFLPEASTAHVIRYVLPIQNGE